MSEKNLWIMVGLPGAGKTTYTKQFEDDPNSIVISRDEIRNTIFPMVDIENFDFTRESKVFKEFCHQIQESIDNNILNIYCDSNHINEGSRGKLLKHLDTKDYNINAIVIHTPIDQCILQNKKRTGIERVPEESIYNMEKFFQHPSNSYRQYNEILDIY